MKNFILKSPAFFFVFAGIIAIIIVSILDTYDEDFNPHDILVEAHGLVYDLFVFGVLLSLYEALRSKKERIERLKDEIDDYRMWNEKEAMYRIVGIIKRLKREGVKEKDLYNTYLSGALLAGADLSGANLLGADLSGAKLPGADLSGANFYGANLLGALLYGTNLSGAVLRGNDLSGVDLREADLSGADLYLTDLSGANFFGANLTGAILFGAKVSEKEWIQDLKGKNVIGVEDIEQRYEVVAKDDYFKIMEKQAEKEVKN
jgi:hypothetical protein